MGHTEPKEKRLEESGDSEEGGTGDKVIYHKGGTGSCATERVRPYGEETRAGPEGNRGATQHKLCLVNTALSEACKKKIRTYALLP